MRSLRGVDFSIELVIGLDTTERLHFHSPLSCTGEGNGNPLQCSCLENPRDGGAWWAAVCGVAQSRTRLSDLAAAAAAVIGTQNTWRRARCPTPGFLPGESRTEETDGLQSVGSQKLDMAEAAACTHAQIPNKKINA